jgi:NAD(P)-dependent dehydrogenase (short-subunit alcohol dehydrogenase family)
LLNGAQVYCLATLTKGGLQSAIKSLAIEYATRGIRANAVSPGIIKTPMNPEESHEMLGALFRSAGWPSRATSSSTWRTPRTSPARSSMSTTGRMPATDARGQWR